MKYPSWQSSRMQLEFLAELSSHVPKVFEQTTRFFGKYSCRSRGLARVKKEASKLIEVNELLEVTADELNENKVKPSSYWAACMKRVFEVDPLECPKCGDQMKIIAFLQDPKEIEKIADNLGQVTWRAPPGVASSSSHEMWVDETEEYSQLS